MKRTANRVLADNLKRLMSAKGLSALALSKIAGVAANTIGNYLDTEALPTSTGKERSAKLAEVEKLAEALGVTVIDLLSDGAPSMPELPHVGGADDETLLQIARDLAVLAPSRRSKFVDLIHQEAEAARELLEYHDAKKEKTLTQAMAAGRVSVDKKTITIKRGDGNPAQGELALTMVADPFTAMPSERENRWYGTLGPVKKPHSV